MPLRPHPVTERPLTAPFLHFRLSDEIQRLKAETDWTSGRRSITLAKQPGLRVVLIAIRAGAKIDRHVASGALTVQVLEGHIRMGVGSETRPLGPGELLTLEPGLPHEVQAAEESVFLLTVAQPAEG